MLRSRIVPCLLCAAFAAWADLALAAADSASTPGAARPALRTPIRDRIRPGFVETVIADSLNSPVSMAIAPDGRVFVCEQGGRLRVIRRDSLLARPFVTLPVFTGAEEGLLGVAFDPHFEKNRRVYVSYTAAVPTRHNRIVRFVAAGDTARPGSATTIFDLDDHVDHVHVGGALRFGPDGKLYAGTGENGVGEMSQSLRSTHGKILRLEPDGKIPADNPFSETATGRHRAIWARGLRNAFALDFEPATGLFFINDVGGDAFEEVNLGEPGANYGWPSVEGTGPSPRFRNPIHSYGHEEGCAITGGAFYSALNTTGSSFPDEWFGRYFYAEYCLDEIRWIAPTSAAKHERFGSTLLPGPVDLRVGRDGCLYYLARGNSDPVGGDNTSRGMVVRVAHAGRAPASGGSGKP